MFLNVIDFKGVRAAFGFSVWTDGTDIPVCLLLALQYLLVF
jgi:hypothetical protein